MDIHQAESRIADFDEPESDAEGTCTFRPLHAGDTDMDITPMIDVTFLLLIFFLVGSRMDVSARVELPEARHGTTVTVANSVVLSVVPAGESIAIYGGETLDAAAELTGDAATQNQKVIDYVARELKGTVPKQQVLLCAAKNVKHREVARLMSAVGEISGAKVYVAVIEESP